MVSSSSKPWKDLKHSAREDADDHYKQQGYTDKEDYRKNIHKDMAEQKRETAAADKY